MQGFPALSDFVHQRERRRDSSCYRVQRFLGGHRSGEAFVFRREEMAGRFAGTLEGVLTINERMALPGKNEAHLGHRGRHPR